MSRMHDNGDRGRVEGEWGEGEGGWGGGGREGVGKKVKRRKGGRLTRARPSAV